MGWLKRRWIAGWSGAFHQLAIDRLSVLQLVAVNFVYAAMVGIADPLLQRAVFDTIGDRQYRSFVLAASALVITTAVVRYTAYRSSLMNQRITNATVERLVLRLVDHFYHIDYKSVISRDSGYYVARVYEEPVTLVQQFLAATSSLLTSVATSAGALAVCFWLSWKLAVILLGVVPLMLYVSRRSRKRIAELFVVTTEQSATLRDGLGRAIKAYVTVNMFNLGPAVRAAVQAPLQSWQSALLRRSQFSALAQGATSGLFSGAELVVLLSGVLMVRGGHMTIGGLMAFLVAYTRVMRSFEVIGTQLPTLATVNAGLTRLRDFLALGNEPQSANGADRLILRNATFGYSRTPILRDFSLKVDIGQRVLLSGPNGCGKSTLAYVLAGFLQAQSNIPSDVQLVPERQRLSALLLPFAFIPGSVKDNVGLETLSDAKARRFFEWAGRFGLLDKVDRDPGTLSQGEQRKVQVIMTLLKDARYYIFDEPLSHLDRESEGLVMELILQQTRNAGLLVIMHGSEEYHGAFDVHVALEHQVAQAA